MKKTENFLIISILLALLSLGGYIFLFLNIKKTNERISADLNALASLSDRGSSLERMKNLVLETETERNTIDSYFVAKDGAVDFIERIEGLGKTAGVKLTVQSVVPETLPAASKDFKEPLVLTVEVEGSWGRMLYFSKLLEVLPIKMEIRGTRLEKVGLDSDSKKEIIWKGRFDFVVFRFR